MPHRSTLEQRRIQRLRALLVLDSEAEPLFDTLARMAAEVCETPIALISLIDEGRQWFKANVGLEGVHETSRALAFCDHAIRGDGLMEVTDASTDPRFQDHPDVRGEHHIRFYAGAPLVTPSGDRIGTLCVVDRHRRQLNLTQSRALRHLAVLAVQALEMRERSVRQSLQVRSEQEQALAASEARLRAILDAQSELVSQSTPDGRLLYVNPAYAAFFGCTVEALVGSNLFDQVAPQDRADVRQRVQVVLATGQTQTSENRMVTGGPAERWVSWTNARQAAADGSLLLHSTGRDISQLVAARAELARQAGTLRALVDAIPSAVAVVDGDGVYEFANSAFQQDLGLPEADIVGQPARQVMGEQGFARRRPWIDRAAAGQPARFEEDTLGPEGMRHIQVDMLPLARREGGRAGYVVLEQDITGLRQEQARLQALSLTDPLTGLLNRSGFTERLNAWMGEGPACALTVLYLDLDHFKPVNDRHGHAAGDALLQIVARRLVRVVRPTDTLARLGGDEFVLALKGELDPRQVQRVADAVVVSLGRPYRLDGVGTVTIGASVGAASGWVDRSAWPALVHAADRQLYEAKRGGRGRSAVAPAGDASASG